MATYVVRYVHKISPSEKDRGPDVALIGPDLVSPTKLAAALRRQGALGAGGRVRDFRVETGGRIVAFPSMPGMSTYWHSIVMEPK